MAMLIKDEAMEAAGLDPTRPVETLSGDELIDLYIELSKISKKAEKIRKSASAEMTAIQDDVVEHFTQLGQERVSRRGNTVYISRDLWPKVLFEDLVEQALLQNGGEELSKEEMDYLRDVGRDRLIKSLAGSPDTEHLVKESYNANSLRGYMNKDLEIDDETGFPIVPEHLEGMLGTSEVFKAKVLSK